MIGELAIVCARCGRSMARAKINVEARIHHGAGGYECIDRKSCERARRRRRKKSW